MSTIADANDIIKLRLKKPQFVLYPDIREELLGLFKLDIDDNQQISNISSRTEWLELEKKQMSRSLKLLELIRQVPELTEDNIGQDGVRAAWLVGMHSPENVMKKVFSMITKYEGDKNLLVSQCSAYLEDRLNILNGHPQKYGTQSYLNEQNQPILFPVMDKSRINKFRDKLSLKPIAHVENSRWPEQIDSLGK